LLLAHSGLRPEEAFALQWEDFDFADGRIHVVRALSAGRIETPKTEMARTVDMSGHLAKSLKKLRVARKEETLRRAWTDLPPWVFCTETGTLLDESKVRRTFATVLVKAELSGVRVGLRPPAYLCLAAAGAGGAHHVRERPAGP
jgi:integrase